jgi:hypothetical protein
VGGKQGLERHRGQSEREGPTLRLLIMRRKGTETCYSLLMSAILLR